MYSEFELCQVGALAMFAHAHSSNPNVMRDPHSSSQFVHISSDKIIFHDEKTPQMNIVNLSHQQHFEILTTQHFRKH